MPVSFEKRGPRKNKKEKKEEKTSELKKGFVNRACKPEVARLCAQKAAKRKKKGGGTWKKDVNMRRPKLAARKYTREVGITYQPTLRM